MTKTVTQYVAVLADAAGSRSLSAERRAELQPRLLAVTRALNRRWRDGLAARFAVTRGDEVEGLLRTAGPLWEVGHGLRAALPDVTWVIACGAGPISTPLAATAPEVDGPCFHAARAALDKAKRERRLFAFQGFPSDVALNGSAAYYSALYWTWTARQRRLAAELRAPRPLFRDEAPGQGAVRESSARSHMRRRMAWPLVAAGDRIFRSLLEAS